MRMMLSTTKKEVLSFQFMASFSAAVTTVSIVRMFLKDERLTTIIVS